MMLGPIYLGKRLCTKDRFAVLQFSSLPDFPSYSRLEYYDSYGRPLVNTHYLPNDKMFTGK